ncbi:HNH endonuclease signature motif containing protein [Nakamurella deserti]|uniref:HNH endonuclease signature motif containing protein n=1 Tax=Nakamurella deserti TaxID=2164074 RepID=UPI000DBE7EAD|nr:HNH endonuclease signature motif containing protein [Nakamurella deserti]
MSTALASPTATHGRALLARIAEQLEALGRLAYGQVAAEELQDLARSTEAVARLVLAVQVAQTVAIDQRGLATAASCPSTASLLRQLLRIPAHEARSRVRAARATRPRDLPSGGEAPAELPLLGAAVDSGLLDRSHLDTVIATMHRLPTALADDVRVEAEQQLVSYATDLEPDQFRKVAAHLAEVLDPDGGLDQDAAAARAEFTIGVRNAATGLTPVHGRLDDLSVETLRLAIDGLAAPRPASDGVPDPRPPAVRRAHALIEVIRRAVGHADLPGHGGRRPQITVTVPWDPARRQLGAAVTDSGATLTARTLRQLLCDADVLPAVLGGDSQVLDLGRSTRTFSRAIRRAITIRDRGCAFPGCDRPPSWTDVHHLRFWTRDLGPTSYDNGCLLCPYHHAEIHKEQWQARMSTDGVPEFVPPRWIDPERRPRRNTVHHLAPVLEPP